MEHSWCVFYVFFYIFCIISLTAFQCFCYDLDSLRLIYLIHILFIYHTSLVIMSIFSSSISQVSANEKCPTAQCCQCHTSQINLNKKVKYIFPKNQLQANGTNCTIKILYNFQTISHYFFPHMLWTLWLIQWCG